MTGPVSVPPQPVKGKSRKPLNIILLTLVSIIVIVAVVGGIYAWLFTRSIRNININEVDIATLPDGTYSGSYSTYHIKVEVLVTVKDHNITNIELIDNPSNKESIEGVLGRVSQEQSLQVELVSGASASQKVALKAVEEALTQNK
jgi:uncharacterized protein with FMN-binding domain